MDSIKQHGSRRRTVQSLAVSIGPSLGGLILTLTMATAIAGVISGAHSSGKGGAAPAVASAKPSEKQSMKKIRITIEGQSATATLADGEATRDFASMLPMTLTLKDYSGTEKIGDLPRKLSTRGAPSGYTPMAGDISYYAPWGNLAIFYRDFRHSEGLVKLGKVYAGMDVLKRPEPMSARIELVGEQE